MFFHICFSDKVSVSLQTPRGLQDKDHVNEQLTDPQNPKQTKGS